MLAKFPRVPGDVFCEEEFADFGCVTEKENGESTFHNLTQRRLGCKKAFAEMDCSQRVTQALKLWRTVDQRPLGLLISMDPM